MKRVSLEDLDPSVLPGGCDRRALSEHLGTADVAINHYRVEPGGGLPGGLHAHADQEVFVVLAGRATFGTLSGEIDVLAGEAIRFAPGEYQSGFNDADAELEILALGAPKETEDVRVPVECSACGHEDLRLDGDHPDGLAFVCPACDAVRLPEACPACGGGGLRVEASENGRTCVRCVDCESTYDRPPLGEPGS